MSDGNGQNRTVAFSESTMKEWEELLSRYPDPEAALLPTLRLAEREFTNIDDAVMLYVAKLMKLPPARVMGVVTFYTHYRREGTGKYCIQICSTLPCALRGSERVFDYVAGKLGVKKNETSADGLFTLKKVECLGSCGTAPMLQCNDDYYENLTDELIDALLEQWRSAE